LRQLVTEIFLKNAERHTAHAPASIALTAVSRSSAADGRARLGEHVGIVCYDAATHVAKAAAYGYIPTLPSSSDHGNHDSWQGNG
jgi:hypothetical protein